MERLEQKSESRQEQRIAVTGSHGFIGNHLVEHLSSEPIRLGRQGFVPNGVDVLFDLASFGNMANQEGDGRIYRANLMRVIEENSWIDDEKWIFVSTSSVMLPTKTAYSMSKKAAEEYLQSSGKKVAIVRPFTIIGPGEQSNHLIPKLIDSCLNGTEMPFVSAPVHDFLHVDDFVEALLTVKDNAQFKGEVYEVGSGMEHSNMDILTMVSDITGREPNIKIVDSLRAYDNKSWRANNERISTLGWKPKRSLYQTIKEMYEHIRSKKAN